MRLTLTSLLGGLILGLSQTVTAAPLEFNETLDELPYYRPSQDAGDVLLLKREDPRDFYLRIMPVGASIVEGWPTPADDPTESANGYRKPLRDQLRLNGWKVNMVGSKTRGKMADNDHEAWRGDRIDQVFNRVRTSAPIWQPNLYLVNAGTNDASQTGYTSGAGERLRSMAEAMFAYTPDAVVIVSTLLEHKNFPDNVADINRQYRSMVKDIQGDDLKSPKAKVYLAEMQDGFIKLNQDMQADGIHPNFEGYRKMAAVWVNAINKVNDLGWLREPKGGSKFPDGEGHSTCQKEYGSGANDPNGAGVQLLYAGDSTIRDDGAYVHKSNPHGEIWNEKINKQKSQEMYLAQLVDFGAPREEALDELVIVEDDTDSMKVYVNRGGGKFDAGASFKVGHKCINRGIHWGDINGDGLDDYICIAPDGTPFVAINTSKRGQVVPTFGNFFKWRNPISGYAQDRVRLGDIDGDGRLDYCVIHDNGNIHCYRNGGLGDGTAYWQDIGSGGPVFLSKNTGDMRGVRFVDVNGDGRSDWVWLDQSGKTQIWFNKRGTGKGLVPFWQQAAAAHPGMGEPIGETRSQVKFGRLYGNGFADYAFFKRTDCLQSTCTGSVNAWENRAMDGTGSRWQKGDGARWGDMTGTGFDDYVWISAFGQINIFPNKARSGNFDWYKSNAWGTVVKFETGFSRRALHITDWDGDGKADIIGVNRATGGLTVWINNWNGKTFGFLKKDVGGSSGFCTLGWGVLYHDTAHHFADITGNGYADYICIAKNGQMRALLNHGRTILSNVGQIKYTEDLDRANFKFADVNGDGLADILHIDKFTGDARVFYNEGQVRNPAENSGSMFKWARPTPAYKGSSNGPNMHFPSLSGQGRADMVEVNPNTAHGWVSFNTCPAGGDDDDTLVDHKLPSYSPGDEGPGQNPSKHWFCDSTAARWDTDMWKDYDMGDWLLDRTAYYSGGERTWPANKKPGVPRVIASYDYSTFDDYFNWPGPQCQSISMNCNLAEADLRNDHCKTHWRRAFSLWGMRNFALYLQSFHSQILDAAVRTSFDTSMIASNFLAIDDPSMNPSAWITIAAGMLTSLVSAYSGPGGVVGNALAGLTAAGAGMAAGFEGSPSLDPRFDKFTELESKLDAITSTVRDATAAYFHRVIIDQPPNHDMVRGTELARILESGAMADQDYGAGDTAVSRKAQRQLLRAPLLSETWNGQDVFIVKFGENQVDLDTIKWKYSPCFHSNPAVDMLGRHNACPGNANYMIGRWTKDPFTMFSEGLGTAKDTLSRLEFNKELIVGRAEAIQNKAREFVPRGMGFVKDALEEASQNNVQNVEDLLWFNIPVCDLTKLSGPLSYGDNCYKDFDNPAFSAYCMHSVIRENCHKVRLDGHEWPLS